MDVCDAVKQRLAAPGGEAEDRRRGFSRLVLLDIVSTAIHQLQLKSVTARGKKRLRNSFEACIDILVGFSW